MVTVRIPQTLRGHTEGAATVSVEGQTVREVLEALVNLYPAVAGRIFDDSGKVRRFVNVFIGEEDIRHSAGLDTVVPNDGLVSILPAVAGGCAGTDELASGIAHQRHWRSRGNVLLDSRRGRR